jgi:hypothetical protein
MAPEYLSIMPRYSSWPDWGFHVSGYCFFTWSNALAQNSFLSSSENSRTFYLLCGWFVILRGQYGLIAGVAHIFFELKLYSTHLALRIAGFTKLIAIFPKFADELIVI